MKLFSAIIGGFAGAAALTLIHESVRRLNSDAPRMDLLGMEAISKTLQSVHVEVPKEDTLFNITMAGDIITNSLYYSLAAIGNEKQVILRGILLGLAAGFGAVYLPRPLGLTEDHSSRTSETKLLTVGMYVAGGVISSVTTLLLEESQNK